MAGCTKMKYDRAMNVVTPAEQFAPDGCLPLVQVKDSVEELRHAFHLPVFLATQL